MMSLSAAATATEAELRGPDLAFDSVGTDTRTLAPRALFVALKGDRFDGHKFVAEAQAAGAVAAMVEDSGSRIQDSGLALPLLVVANTRLALGRLAACWRSRFTMPLVALTGSSGKTTVKEMLAGILREACAAQSSIVDAESCVLATRGNLNNDIGVPLMLLELKPNHRFAVIEMGMNHAGEIRYLTRLAAPDVALVNNAGRAHMAFFASEEAIARAKGELYEDLKAKGTAVINADERFAPLWRELAAGRKQIDFGIDREATVTATYALRYLESEIVVKMPRGEAGATLKAPGLHNVKNALAAAAAATALDIGPQAVTAGLARFTGMEGRLQKKPGLNGATLIDDTYNANPESVRAAIAVLAQAPGRKLLVMGDMGELGADAPRLHAEMGEAARVAGIDHLLTLGEVSAHAARAFGSAARHFSRIEDLLAEIENLLEPGITALVKGSRFMQMERVVKAFAVEREATGERREAKNP
ncbi:MAG: UDP-N-acetylmuramoyl-tripeptide--D-alanyl-D-alanine ligase [Betaproteobacteria bacterium RIFCSPLOWO2_12_FULL_62_58]|nr:MAG: UDP-N-acetylmuramoyl-tripeptide--D-alanyl-D-alanine ligase [Betaproteobacteria bacterium RIFCSPLOWO2_02_FULL_62_79]OGA49082.1 MAG: UDP-N-acetylmuramoyl-tripeptide--D-alanyl-D-alanine ligase [Betaproteobacteria bacterium RIFCSPLOWO2_12_FULL_62_58]